MSACQHCGFDHDDDPARSWVIGDRVLSPTYGKGVVEGVMWHGVAYGCLVANVRTPKPDGRLLMRYDFELVADPLPSRAQVSSMSGSDLVAWTLLVCAPSPVPLQNAPVSLRAAKNAERARFKADVLRELDRRFPPVH